MTRMWIIYLLLLVLCICTTRAQISNTPPEVNVAREWILSETDEIDSIVARITVKDEENDKLTLRLGEPRSPMPSGNNFKDGYTYFYIDEQSRVRLRKSLHGLAGESFLVSILLHDGQYTTRTDVRVRIIIPNGNVKISSALADALAVSKYNLGHIANVQRPNLANVQLSESKQPPYLHMDPNTVWKVSSDAKPGTIVTVIEADDYSNTFLKLTIDPDDFLDINEINGEVSVKTNLSKEIGTYAITVTASNGHASVSEPITLEILDENRDQTTQTDQSLLTIYTDGPIPSSKAVPSLQPKDTTTKPSTIIKVLKKGTPNTTISSSKESDSITWIIQVSIYLALIFAIIIAVILVYRWLLRRKTPINHKSLSVRYSENSTTSNSSKKDKMISDILTVVGIGNRADGNKYESSNIGIKKMLNTTEIKSSLNMKKDRWEFPRHKLRFIDILGEGSFGQVWKCEATDLLPDDADKCFVAVKTVKESAGSEEQRDLLQELKVLKNLEKHPNVVSLLGCCTQNGPTFVILEHMTCGTLQSYLRNCRSNCPYGNLYRPSDSLTPKDLTIFAFQVAKGMNFLSENNIIHRDLAARNILVGQNKICKVADFGFARDIANNHVYERKSDGRLPIRWMAPESLYDNIFTTKSDVWSFGILLWEIVTLGSIPYPGISAGDVMRKVKIGYRLEKPAHCRREIYNIMYYCWDSSSNDRPTFIELVKNLESLINSEVDYIKLDNFSDHDYYNFNTQSASGELL